LAADDRRPRQEAPDASGGKPNISAGQAMTSCSTSIGAWSPPPGLAFSRMQIAGRVRQHQPAEPLIYIPRRAGRARQPGA
jgi:hypothetical protein